MSSVAELFMKPEKFHQKQKDDFRRYSSEANAEKQAELNRIFAENQELDRIHKNKEVVLDKSVNEKLFSRFSKRVVENHSSKFRPLMSLATTDLIQEPTQSTKRQLQVANDTSSTDDSATIYLPNMDPDVLPDVELYTIEESYPD